MKTVQLLFLFILLSSISISQNYNSTQTIGTSSPYQFADGSAITLLENTSADTLSAPQTIPFTFNFYGVPVSQYLASDNGYITFDTGSTVSDPANVSIPDTNGPNNAIYAFWDDMELTLTGTDDEVRSFTYGTAPKRVHVIQWYSVTPFGQTSYLYAAIRLYECGDFDIVHNYATATGVSGTVGCEDATGANGTQITGSPSLPFSALGSDPSDDEVYSFYWDQIQYDLSVSSSGFNDFVSVGSNNVTGSLINTGSLDITSFDLHYTVDAGPAQTMPVSTSVAANGGNYNFSHSIPWNVAAGGATHTLCIWADNLNGNADERNCNDTFCEDLFANNGISGTRTILLEEFTGSWCGYCPDGALKLDNLIANYPGNVVGVSIHNGDGMTFSDGIQTGFNVTSYPSGMINRTLVSGQAKEPFTRSLWEAEVTDQIGSYTPVDVSLTSTYNITNRELNITVSADFVDFASGDLRFVAMLVEDSVTGTGSGYDQVNYYSSGHSSGGVGGSGHPNYNDPTPIIGYVHNHVLRAVPGGAFGNSGVISSPVMPGTSVSESFTINVPTSINENKIKVIGFVAYYSTEIGSRSILDVAEVTPTSFVGIDESTNNRFLNLFPNPATDFVEVLITDDNFLETSCSMKDMTGKIIKEEQLLNNRWMIDLTDMSAGLYLISCTSESGTIITKKLIVK
ncbi:MAG: Omp28-related outer membrane protein [Crocinitomicaceae bacterium]|jgi:thiol-disulfide isomerase/thioredoxin|nr:Omp28-related outer membrane protein [Crocinitomicaceae bacterium]